MTRLSTAASSVANEDVRALVTERWGSPRTPGELFDVVSDLEEDVGTVRDLVRSINMMFDGRKLEDQRDAAAFYRLVWLAQDAIEKVEAGRCALFAGLHAMTQCRRPVAGKEAAE